MTTVVSIKSCKGFAVKGPPELSGFVWAFNPAAPGSSPKHTNYASIIYSQICAIFVSCEKNENKQKETGFGPFKN